MDSFRIPDLPELTLDEFHAYQHGAREVSNLGMLPNPRGNGSTDGGHCRPEETGESKVRNDVKQMEIIGKLAPKKQKYRAASRPPLLPPCRVCMDRASGYHYGVNTCEACKGFFRRSIMKKQCYACVGDGDCSTTKGMRTACAACRYQKCLEVGMSKDAIKTGRYTHELRSKNIREVKNLKLRDNSTAHDTRGALMMSQRAVSPMAPSATSREIIERNKMLENLVAGQRLLYEYLDDNFNDDLLLERQVRVYNRYMGGKVLPQQSSHIPADEQCFSRSSILTSRLNDCPPTYNDSVNSVLDSRGSSSDVSKKSIERDDVTEGDQKYGSTLNGARHNPMVDSNIHVKFTDMNTRNDSEPYTSNSNGRSNTNIEDSFQQPNKQDVIVVTSLDEPTERGNRVDYTNDNSVPPCTARAPEHSFKNPEDSVGKKKETFENVSVQEKGKERMMQILTDMEKSVLGILSFARCLPGFKNLPKEDQASLVKAARFDIWYIGHIRCFNTELRVGTCEWQFHGDELSQVWGKDVVDLAFRVSKQGQLLRLTKEETACLRAVSLSFPDRCYPLTDRDAVERLHNNMFEMFKHSASRRNKNFNLWFAKVTSFLALLREFGIKFEEVSSNLPLDWELIHKDPYLLSVFLS